MPLHVEPPALEAQARYRDAAAFIPPHVNGLVRNARVIPRWIGPTPCFWYQRAGPELPEFILIDPRQRLREAVFDHQRIDHLLIPKMLTRGDIVDLDIDSDLRTVTLRFKHLHITIDRTTGDVLDERAAPAADLNRHPYLPSPDGTMGAFCTDHNLWVMHTDGTTRQLTFDGKAHAAYGKLPDTCLVALVALRLNLQFSPYGVAWSPKADYIVASLLDESDVPAYPFIDATTSQTSRPRSLDLRRTLLGERDHTRNRITIIDLQTGHTIPSALPEGLLFTIDRDTCWWNADPPLLFTAAWDPAYREVFLFEIDLRTGICRKILEEHAATHHDFNLVVYRAPNIRVLNNGRDIIWFSERDGWAHLYLYDGRSGQLVRQLTQGRWVVNDIVEIDEARRLIYFTASGREASRNPYHQHLYRISLDGSDPILLTPENEDHVLRVLHRPPESIVFLSGHHSAFSPDQDFFVETHSTVNQPPRSTIRAAEDGHVVLELERADVADLEALQYRPPVIERIRAADGETDIYAAVYLPPDYRADLRYPVIEALYAAPPARATKFSFTDALWEWNPPGATALSRLGFIVVQIDGRSSPGRDKVFHDHTYGRFGDGGLADHLDAFRQLAIRYPAMDLHRIGVYGYSLGAYFAVRAMLTYPDFYKAGIGIGGGYDFSALPNHMIQKWNGPVPPGETLPPQYETLDLSTMAARLQGALLLVTGDIDAASPPAASFRLLSALIAADKDFEQLAMPGLDHLDLPTHPYVLRRIWDFFLRHLG